MEEYYFLFALGLIWSIFATIQDFKTREVSNWLNFSLIGCGLSYRAFYSVFDKDLIFFVSGLLGFGVFFVLAHLFYYGRVFAGGDAKLLMGIGVILPYGNFIEMVYLGAFFLFSLFFVGALYSLSYSVFIVVRKRDVFKREFRRIFRKSFWMFFIFFVFIVFLFLFFELVFSVVFSIFLFLTPFLYVYIRALDFCMIELKSARDLSEGDWLEKDVKIGRIVIKKSVHGLSLDEIKILQKARKKVLIKEGIPFTFAFLLAFIIMGFFFLVLGFEVVFSLF